MADPYDIEAAYPSHPAGGVGGGGGGDGLHDGSQSHPGQWKEWVEQRAPSPAVVLVVLGWLVLQLAATSIGRVRLTERWGVAIGYVLYFYLA
jgi:hypothetical protein